MTRSLWWSTIALVASLLLLATGCGQTNHAVAGTNAGSSPPELKSIEELRSVFNAASREPTLVVLVAPT